MITPLFIDQGAHLCKINRKQEKNYLNSKKTKLTSHKHCTLDLLKFTKLNITFLHFTLEHSPHTYIFYDVNVFPLFSIYTYKLKTLTHIVTHQKKKILFEGFFCRRYDSDSKGIFLYRNKKKLYKNTKAQNKNAKKKN